MSSLERFQAAFDLNSLAYHPITIALALLTILSLGLPILALSRRLSRSSLAVFTACYITLLVSLVLALVFISRHPLGTLNLHLAVLRPFLVHGLGTSMLGIMTVLLHIFPTTEPPLTNELAHSPIHHVDAAAFIKQATIVSGLQSTIQRLEALLAAAEANNAILVTQNQAAHNLALSSARPSLAAVKDLEANLDVANKQIRALNNALSQQDRKLASHVLTLKKRDAECLGLQNKVKQTQAHLEARNTRIWELEAELATAKTPTAIKSDSARVESIQERTAEYSSHSASVVEFSLVPFGDFRPPVDSNTSFLLAGLLPWSQSSSEITESSLQVSAEAPPAKIRINPMPTTTASARFPRPIRATACTPTQATRLPFTRTAAIRPPRQATREAAKENVPPSSARTNVRRSKPPSSKIARLSPSALQPRHPLAPASLHTTARNNIVSPSGLRPPAKRAGVL